MKRSEFYAMFITMIVLFSASMSWAVSYQPQIIQPTKPHMVLHSSTTNTNDTYFTVLDISGKGILMKLFTHGTVKNYNLYFKITIDGVATELYENTSTNVYFDALRNNADGLLNNVTFLPAYYSLSYPCNLYFKTSLKVELKQISGSDNKQCDTRIDYALE